MGLALWRGLVANRQTKISQDQFNSTLSELMRQTFHVGMELLVKEDSCQSFSGIQILRDIAVETRDQQIVKRIIAIFCFYIQEKSLLERRTWVAEPGTSSLMDKIRDTDFLIGLAVSHQRLMDRLV